MEKRDFKNYQYPLRLHSLVDNYLAEDLPDKNNLPEMVVNFCIFTERILKIRLYKKNPFLIFNNSKLTSDDIFIAIIKNKENNINTIEIDSILYRFNSIFKSSFSNSEVDIILGIFKIRNHFVHSYKSDNDILEDYKKIIKKMATVWEKISKQAEIVFGKKAIKFKKPKSVYSEGELGNLLREQVREKLDSYKNKINYFSAGTVSPTLECFAMEIGEKCPRCGTPGFSKQGDGFDVRFAIAANFFANPSDNFSNLYVCKKCNLELTEKEYEIAQKIQKEKDSKK